MRRNLRGIFIFAVVTVAKVVVLGTFHTHPCEEVAMDGLIDFVAYRSLELLNRVTLAPDSGAFVIR